MNQPTEIQSLSAEMTALREAYAALNRGDIDGFIKDFDPQIMRVEFEGTPQGGSYQGIAAVREHVLQGRSTWAEGSCEPERFIVAGDSVVVICHVRVRLNGHADWLEGHTGDVFTWKDGKVIEFRTFAEENDAIGFADQSHNG